MSTYQKHMAAIMYGQVSKTHVIGIRKMINAAERLAQGLSVSITAPRVTVGETLALRRLLSEREPQVTGDLDETGKKLLRSSRYRKRWNEQQAAIIDRLDHFKLVNFDIIGSHGLNSVPVYRAVATTGQSFLFRNIPWQSGGDGPEIVREN